MLEQTFTTGVINVLHPSAVKIFKCRCFPIKAEDEFAELAHGAEGDGDSTEGEVEGELVEAAGGEHATGEHAASLKDGEWDHQGHHDEEVKHKPRENAAWQIDFLSHFRH